MSLFSERKGYKPVKDALQVECMDDDLRNSFWNVIAMFPLKTISDYTTYSNCPEEIQVLISILYKNYWKLPVDEFFSLSFYPYQEIRKYFFKCEWFDVYDFLEILIEECYYINTDQLINDFNEVLKNEKSGYRLVDGIITEITSKDEINEIEEVLTNSPDPVKVHLHNALVLLSDKESPDYRNSIKESISAVESLCKLITGESLSLGQALNKIEKKGILKLHPDLKEGFKKIYGYTSDSDGIRHGLSKESNLDYEDAKFMLVACSAFINYLRVKWNKSK